MKYKLLIIAEAFGDPTTVASTRITNFAKYLPPEKWEKHVICHRFTNVDDQPLKDEYADFILRIDYNPTGFIDKNIFHRITRFFKPEKSRDPGLYELLYSKIDDYLVKNKIDIILATTSDLHTLALAKKMSNKHNIPWVADIRDIWEQYIFNKRVSNREELYRIRSIKRRNKLINSASYVIVANNYANHIKKESKNNNVILIRNGYDPSVFLIKNELDNVKTSKCTFAHVGTLASSTPERFSVFFEAVKELIGTREISKSAISIDFYGSEKDSVKPFIPTELNDIVNFYSRQPQQKINKEIFPTVGAFLLSSSPNLKYAATPTKFYEYCTAKKPIICVVDVKDIRDIMAELKNGKICLDKESMKIYILSIIKEHQAKGYNYIDIPDNKIKQFSRQDQTLELSQILEQILSNNI